MNRDLVIVGCTSMLGVICFQFLYTCISKKHFFIVKLQSARLLPYNFILLFFGHQNIAPHTKRWHVIIIWNGIATCRGEMDGV